MKKSIFATKVQCMKKLFFSLLIPFLVSCNNQNTPQATSESNDESASSAVATAQETGGSAQNGEALTISAPEMTAKSGETVCVDVVVAGFNKLLSMQYTITWNQKILVFKELKNFQLPYLDINDFGTTKTNEGILTIAWIDESLKGATLADGSAAYQVCFVAKGKAGESSYFKITDRPTSIEVVNLREKVIPLKKKAGKVTMQ